MDEMLKQVTEAVKEGIGGVQAEVKTIGETVKGIQEKQAELDAKVSQIENVKAPALGANINKLSSKYKGYSLSKQMREIRERAAKDPMKYPTFSNDEKAEDCAKYMIDFVKAAGLKDVQAQMDLQTKASEMVEGTENLGGYLVPEEYQDDFIKLAEENSFALQNATVLNMSRDVLTLPTEAGRVSVTWEDEAADIDESNSSFGQVKLTAKKLAGLTDGISIELLQDSAIDIAGLLMGQFSYAIGLELESQMLNGTGNPCSGVLTAAAGYSVVMSLANFSSVSASDFSLMISKLTDKDIAGSKFVFNRLITHYVRSLKDTTNAPIFSQISAREPRSIYGLPIVESSVATATTGSSTAFAVLGDFKKFYIGRRLGALSLDSDPYTEFNKAMVRFRVLSRWGMAVARNTAFVRLVTG